MSIGFEARVAIVTGTGGDRFFCSPGDVAAGHGCLGPGGHLREQRSFLRDKSFARLNPDDFRPGMDVHLVDAVQFTKAVWSG